MEYDTFELRNIMILNIFRKKTDRAYFYRR